MSHRKQIDNQQRDAKLRSQNAPSDQNGRSTHSPAPTPQAEAALQRIVRLIAAGSYQKALDQLKGAGGSPQVRNLQGVCLLRLGRADEAIQLFRSLVMKAGTTWMRPDAPTAHKLNFATALLLGGRPSGCLDMLSDIDQEQLAGVQQLRAAIKRWQKSLSWLQRLNWSLLRIEPRNCRVTLDYMPGELDLPTAPLDAPSPTPGPNLGTAL